MRILGFVLMIVALLPIGWGGFVEFVYLDEPKRQYKQRITQVETAHHAAIEQAREQYQAQLAQYENGSGIDARVLEEAKSQAEEYFDQAAEMQEQAYKDAIEVVDDAFKEVLDAVRSESSSRASLAGGIGLLGLGAFLGFRRSK